MCNKFVEDEKHMTSERHGRLRDWKIYERDQATEAARIVAQSAANQTAAPAGNYMMLPQFINPRPENADPDPRPSAAVVVAVAPAQPPGPPPPVEDPLGPFPAPPPYQQSTFDADAVVANWGAAATLHAAQLCPAHDAAAIAENGSANASPAPWAAHAESSGSSAAATATISDQALAARIGRLVSELQAVQQEVLGRGSASSSEHQ